MNPICQPVRRSHRIRSGFILETGIGVSEASHCRWSWIVKIGDRPTLCIPDPDPVTGFRPKNGRRSIPLSARAQRFLVEAADKWGKDGFVLHGQEHPPLTTNWRRNTNAACKKAGVTDVDTHGLRRTAGARWIFCGLGIYTVSKLLGHSSVAVTERSYAGMTNNHLETAMDIVDDHDALTKLPERSGSDGEKGGKSVAPPAPNSDDRNP